MNEEAGIPIMQPITVSGKKGRVSSRYKNLTLTIPDLSSHPLPLGLGAGDSHHICLSNQVNLPKPANQTKPADQESEGPYSVELCFDEAHLSLDVTQNGLPKVFFFGALAEPQAPVEGPVVPEELTIRSAVEIALANNEELLNEKQVVVQAKEKARKAYLSLLPHLNLNPLLVTTLGELCGFFEFGTGLISFLLPSKWVDARMAQYQAKANALGETALKLNVAASVHLQAITHARLSELLAELTQLRSEFVPVIEAFREDRAYPTQVDIIQGLGFKLGIAIRETEERIDEAAVDLSNTLGLDTSEKIKRIVVHQETPPVDHALVLDDQQLQEEKQKLSLASLLNSCELRQYQAMKEAARLNEKLVYLGWLGR